MQHVNNCPLFVVVIFFVSICVSTPAPSRPVIKVISPISISVTWEPVPNYSGTYIIIDASTGESLFATFENEAQLAITPRKPLSLKISVYDATAVDNKRLSPSSFEVTTQFPSVPNDRPVIIQTQGDKVAVGWKALSNNDSLGTYEVQHFAAGKWTPLRVLEGTQESFYYTEVRVTPGVNTTFRIAFEDRVSESVSFATTAGAYDNIFHPFKVTEYFPVSVQSSSNANILNSSSFLYLRYDLSLINTNCEILYSRLVIPQFPDTSEKGGFLRVYANTPTNANNLADPFIYDPNYFFSRSALQIMPQLGEYTEILADLDRVLPDPYDINSLYSSWISSSSFNAGFILSLESKSSVLTTSAQEIKLQIAQKKNYRSPAYITQSAFSVNFGCGQTHCSTYSNWETIQFNNPLNPDNSQVVVSLKLTIFGFWNSVRLTASVNGGYIGDQILPERDG